MRLVIPMLLVSLTCAGPASAQLNTYYEGMHRVNGKPVPLTTQFSVDRNHAVAVMKAEQTYRMVYTVKDNTLRLFDDDHRRYLDLDRQSLEQLTGAGMGNTPEQMAKVPPEQRAMMEKMMAGMMGGAAPPPPTYVRSDAKQRVLGYECTRVDIMRGSEKRAEYWGSTSPDFELSEDERRAIRGMDACLGGLDILVKRGGPGVGETTPFQWDPAVEGYPLISRCVEDTVRTLDITMTRFDRKPLDPVLTTTPDGYAKMDMGMGGDGRRGHHGR